MRKLVEVFEGLAPPVSGSDAENIFSVKQFGVANIWLGKSVRGKPAFLIQLPDLPRSTEPISLDLVNLRALHRCSVTLIEDIEKRNVTASLIECLSEDDKLQSLFLETVGSSLSMDSSEVSGAQVQALITHLAELFRLVISPGSGNILGLWAELLLINIAEDPAPLCHAWHPTTTGHADFATNQERLEVKATTTNYRRHHMSFEQANPPDSVFGAIASIMTEEIGDGVSLGELWSGALRRVSGEPDLCNKIDRLCIRTLGTDWATARECSFDWPKAVETFRIFSVVSIPRISRLSRGISSVRFESDMTGSTPLNVSAPEVISGGLVDSVLSGLQEV